VGAAVPPGTVPYGCCTAPNGKQQDNVKYADCPSPPNTWCQGVCTEYVGPQSQREEGVGEAARGQRSDRGGS
jgi:hypothetical protein